MSDLPADRALDVEIATKVMGLTVVALDWPCGMVEEELVACLSPDGAPGWCNERHPVYRDAEGELQPVSFYSTELTAAWTIIEHFRQRGAPYWVCGLGIRCETQPPYTCNFYAIDWDWSADAEDDTAPLAICRAALATLDQKE